MNNQRRKSVWLLRAIHVFIPVGLTVFLFACAIFAITLPSLKDYLMTSKSEMIKEITTSVWYLLSDYNRKVQLGELTLIEAQELAKEQVRSIRYGPEGKDYLWINDMTPVMVMHPYRSDLEGKNVSDYVDPNDKHLFIEFRDKVKSDGAGFIDYMWQWKDNPDHIVPKLSYVIGFEPWGWIIGTGIYVEDVRITIESITKKLRNILIVILIIIIFISIYIVWQGIKTDLALEAANEELLKNTRLTTLGMITGKVGHDLRNPLSTIQISINLIEKKICDQDPSLRNVIQRIKRGISRCNNIINELLEYTRIGNLELENTDIDNWLNSLVKDYQFMEDIHVNLNLNSHITLNIDKERFYRCIVNILSNSIESMEENLASNIDKQLTISSNVKDNNLIISFEDNGSGIPDDIKDKIFEPLFTTKTKGIGLGMTIIKQIMQQQGGEIEISSETGKGTIVTLILPIKN